MVGAYKVYNSDTSVSLSIVFKFGAFVELAGVLFNAILTCWLGSLTMVYSCLIEAMFLRRKQNNLVDQVVILDLFSCGFVASNILNTGH